MPTEKEEEEGSARLSDAASSFRFQMFSIGAIVPLPFASEKKVGQFSQSQPPDDRL